MQILSPGSPEGEGEGGSEGILCAIGYDPSSVVSLSGTLVRSFFYFLFFIGLALDVYLSILFCGLTECGVTNTLLLILILVLTNNLNS